MVEVGRFDTRTDAEFARSLLAAAGIPCVLAPDEAAGAYTIDHSGRARVLVADRDAHDAAVILRHHGYRPADAPGSSTGATDRPNRDREHF